VNRTEGEVPWKPVLELAGAAAGLALLIQLAGGAIMWARFRALGLPAAQGVSLLPPQYLLAVGSGALFWAVLLGLLSVVALYAVRQGLSTRLEHWAGPIVSLVLVATVPAASLVMSLSPLETALALGVALALAGTLAVLSYGATNMRRVGIALMLVTAVLGGALTFIRDFDPPARFELAMVFLRNGDVTSGAYITTTSSDVFLAPDSFDHTYGEIVAIPRDAVARVSFSAPQDFRAAGQEDPRALLGGGESRPGGSQARIGAVERYFAAHASNPVWTYPPISYLSSLAFLCNRLDEYFPRTAQRWREHGLRVKLRKLVSDAYGYSGRAVITHGKVRQATPVEIAGRSDVRTQYLTLTTARSDGPRVICGVTTSSSRRFREGIDVEARGVVVAAGSLMTTAEAGVKGAFMQCAAVRRYRRGHTPRSSDPRTRPAVAAGPARSRPECER
jgi:hypothetical protein